MAAGTFPQSLGFDGDGELAQKLRKTGSVFEQVEDSWNLASRARAWYHTKTRWGVSVAENDRLYTVALKWLLDTKEQKKPPRNVQAKLTASYGGHISADDLFDDVPRPRRGHRPTPSVSVLYDEHTERNLDISGHKVRVVINRNERVQSRNSDSFTPAQPGSLNFYAGSYEGQQAVIAKLNTLAANTSNRKPALNLMNQWGEWTRRDDLPARGLDTVVLHEGQMELIRDDLQKFMDEETDYVRRGLPYHRGYMLHGPPGTGKTSVVRALAAHFKLDLWYAPLGDLQKDSSLMSVVNQVQPGSILLLEDVDVFHAMTSRDEESGSVTMAGLLNALDGVATPHGLITFMTTNDLSVIDPALIRPGRVDVLEEIGMAVPDQIRRLFNSWYKQELTVDEFNHRVTFTGSPAAVTEIFKKNLDDPMGALDQLTGPPADERSVTAELTEETRHERSGHAERPEG